MGGLVGGIAGAFQTRKGRKAAEAASAAAQAQLEAAVRELEKIGIPTIEAQKIALEMPEIVGLLEAEQLGPSAIEEIMVDPRLSEDQRQALAGMKEISREGITPEDRAKYEAFRSQAMGDEQARQESILQSMAERGTLDSGAQLAAQLSSAQQAGQSGRQEALDLMSQSSQARREALQRAGQMAGDIGEQEYGRDMNAANARDRIQQFNLAQRSQTAQQNLGTRQRMAEQQTALRNQQQQYNKQLQQQKFTNEMAKGQSIANARTGLASNIMGQGQQQFNMRQAQGQGYYNIGQGVDKGIETAAKSGMFGAADGGVKEDEYANGGIEPLKRQEIPIYQGGSYQNPDFSVNPIIEQQKEEDEKSNGLSELLKRINMPTEEVSSGASVANGGVIRNAGLTDENELNAYEKIKALGITGATGYNNGGYEKMGYEEGGPQTEGRFVPGEDFQGDELPDRINSGELVLNVKQQDRLNNMLQALKRLRTDEKLELGLANVNEPQQDAMFETIKGERPIEALPEQPVVEETGLMKLRKMIGME